MQLLVSVADAADAGAAIDGGADIIDAKDPTRGPLGPVHPETLAAIIASVGGRRPVSAALDECGAFGDRLRCLAFGKLTRPRSIPGCAIVLAAFADRQWEHVVEEAVRCGAYGVLLDTSDKDGPGLFRVVCEHRIGQWVETAHAAGLTVALAGRLTAEDLPRAAALGADIAGVRGAACEGGRSGRVSAERVRALASVARRGISPMPACL